MSQFESWIDARVTEAEEYLTGQWGEEDYEDQYQAEIQEIAGPFVDGLRKAVEALQAIYARHHMQGDGSAGKVSGDALRALGIDPDAEER